jgi:hypothetical protein
MSYCNPARELSVDGLNFAMGGAAEKWMEGMQHAGDDAASRKISENYCRRFDIRALNLFLRLRLSYDN